MSLFLPPTTHYHCEHIAGVSSFIFTQHVLCETSISLTAYCTGHKPKDHIRPQHKHAYINPLAKETILLLSDRWLGIYDMHQLTWLAPHNELGDGDCHHLLIIPMVEILSVMSYATIPASYETVTVLYILYYHFQMVGGPTRVIKNHKQPHSLTTNR